MRFYAYIFDNEPAALKFYNTAKSEGFTVAHPGKGTTVLELEGEHHEPNALDTLAAKYNVRGEEYPAYFGRVEPTNRRYSV